MEKSLGTRILALNIITEVLSCHESAGELVNSMVHNSNLDDRDRKFVFNLIYGTLKNIARTDHILAQFCHDNSTIHIVARNILRLAIYQLLFMNRTPPYAIINTSVEASKIMKISHLKGFINGTLRNISRNLDKIQYPDRYKNPPGYLATYYSYPEWLIRRWLTRLTPGEVEKICARGNEPAPLYIRVNLNRTSPDKLQKRLEEQGHILIRHPLFEDFFLMHSMAEVHHSREFQEGLFTFQDPFTKLPLLLLDPQPGEKVLDICSFPGGKLAYIDQFMKSEGILIGIDNNIPKLEMTISNLRRLKCNLARIIIADAVEFKTNLKFDKILVDAPCSSLGVLRRYPEAKLFREEEDIFKSARVQRAILHNAINLLKNGGRLVYSTCTSEPEENQAQVAYLKELGFVTAEIPTGIPSMMVRPEGWVSTFPNDFNIDGGFSASLIKTN
ncbi:16S rRNA (cytosine(967)-C(5))-methyltransferase RsmB [bacterium]|nr:16S rRNA (cytosine(967)-C(5))-methyltransferase RsmB [bacterium]